MIRVTVDAPEVARAIYNAHAFIPARSPVPFGLIRVTPEGVYTSGTDSYAAGTDSAATTGFIGQTAEVLIARDDLLNLERCAREAKKVAATVEVKSDGLTVEPIGCHPVTVPIHISPGHLEVHHRLADLISEAEKRPGVIPGVMALDPQLWSRFAKVKADKAERIADLLMTDAYEPVFIKIGPTFKGLLMPIERLTHETNIGPEGLW